MKKIASRLFMSALFASSAMVAALSLAQVAQATQPLGTGCNVGCPGITSCTVLNTGVSGCNYCDWDEICKIMT